LQYPVIFVIIICHAELVSASLKIDSETSSEWPSNITLYLSCHPEFISGSKIKDSETSSEWRQMFCKIQDSGLLEELNTPFSVMLNLFQHLRRIFGNRFRNEFGMTNIFSSSWIYFRI